MMENGTVLKFLPIEIMKKSRLILALSLVLTPLTGQDVQQIADNLEIPPLKPGEKQLRLPKIQGAQIRLLGADYEQLIDRSGKIRPVIADTPVNVSFKLTQGDREAVSRDYEMILKAPADARAAHPQNSKPRVIPEILQWKSGTGEYMFEGIVKIRCADQGLAALLAKDLKEVLGKRVEIVGAGEACTIALNLVKGCPYGDEAYKLNINSKGIEITAAHRRGLYWGTRTLLQMLRQNPAALPCGTALDFPRYRIRGFMLDIARTPYPLPYLRDVIDTMAWYKMNDFHIVINNNYIWLEDYAAKGRDPFKEGYAAFRLESKIKGRDGTPLTAGDLFYTKKDFIKLVEYANERGVNIVPEIDTPAHALSLTRVRPDLIYRGVMKSNPLRHTGHLDAANAETIKFVKEVFDEYLIRDPKLKQSVFGGCPVIHVGADEFFGETEAYRGFADALLKHTLERGYTPRIWGGLSRNPGKTPVSSSNVQMNLWSSHWMKAWEAVRLGYDVINTNDNELYIVPYANYYNNPLKNRKNLYEKWLPNRIGNETLPSGHPQLIGATFALWNDYTDLRHTGNAPVDLWSMISDTMNVLAQKMWGTAKTPNSYAEHNVLVKKIGDAPGANPLHLWKNPDTLRLQPDKLPMQLNRPALGPSYRLAMEVELISAPEGEEQTLLSGPEGELIAVMRDGTIGFRRDDTLEYSFGVKLPVGSRVKLELAGKPERTELFLDGKPVGTLVLNTFLDSEENFKPKSRNIRSTFILPLKTVGKTFKGKVYSLEVTPQ